MVPSVDCESLMTPPLKKRKRKEKDYNIRILLSSSSQLSQLLSVAYIQIIILDLSSVKRKKSTIIKALPSFHLVSLRQKQKTLHCFQHNGEIDLI